MCGLSSDGCAFLKVLDGGGVALVGGIPLLRGPEGQVVPEELHDEGRVLVRLLRQGVELGDRVVERRLGQVARPVRGVQDLVEEHREVEGESEADRVGRRQGLGGDGRGVLVRLEGLPGALLLHVAVLELGEVSVVVALHLVVEHLALLVGRVGHQVVDDDGQDVVADLDELVLDLRLVVLDELELVRVRLLLDRAEDAPRRAAGANHVLVRDREEVALLDRELGRLGGHRLHVVHHLVEPFGLLGELGEVDE
mmetsp:Transcript_64622/g.145771  ORF Transcript_64622/g.145771 Transcript_64622/m.145771 type:complete len:253 (+) Transcript_64622:311-1069(+)